eukprot:1274895-Amphidinium_carterae.3
MTEYEVCEIRYFQSDHRLLQCLVASNSSMLKMEKSVRPKARKVRGPDHSLAIKLALATRDHGDWKQLSDPVAAMNACCAMIRDVVKHAPGSKAKPNKAWIGEESWQRIREGAEVRRKLNKAWKNGRRAHLRWAWQCLGKPAQNWTCFDELAEWNAQCDRRVCQLVWSIFRVVAKRCSKKVQCAVRTDKLAWLESKTEQLASLSVDGTSSDLHRQVKRCLTKVTPNISATSRGTMKDAMGKIYTTDDEKQMLWQGHWAALYGGRILSQTRSFQDCRMPVECKDQQVEVTTEDLFLEQEVLDAMVRQFNGKASVDSMPTKEMAVLKQQMAPIWTKAYNEFIKRGDVPTAYKGTLLFVVPKKVATSSTSDFRGLQLMLWSAKVFARALFSKCMQRAHIAAGQYGLGANAGVDYPHLILTQVREYALVNQIRMAWLFVDVRTAFDRIIRQLISQPGHELSLSFLLQMGIEQKVACTILEEVANDVPVLWEHDFSPAIQRMLTSLLRGTWLTLPEAHGGTQLETQLGTPQGNSLSGLLYILYQQRVLSLISQFTHECGFSLMLNEAEDNTFCSRRGSKIPVPVLAYHDDALVMVAGANANELLDMVRQVVRYATSCYHGRNLMLNWAKLKSELMVILPRGEIEPFHATVNSIAAEKNWAHPALEVDKLLVRIVRSYPYLGKKLQDTGATWLHAKDRCTLAATSVRSFARVYSAGNIPSRVK